MGEAQPPCYSHIHSLEETSAPATDSIDLVLVNSQLAPLETSSSFIFYHIIFGEVWHQQQVLIMSLLIFLVFTPQNYYLALHKFLSKSFKTKSII